ncbi:MAG TPA: PhzF family phenazine biosynthesis protein [Gammaproteobacteria bacterium]
MTRLRLYQVDAFTSRRFAGNPAAVVPLDEWLDDGLLQAIAAENNLSETAFFVPGDPAYRLRWFTPTVEVQLCGHATLASAFVLFTELEPGRTEVRFDTASGELGVSRLDDGRLELLFPAWRLERVAPPDALVEGLGVEPIEVLATPGRDYLFAVLESEAAVAALAPDLHALAALHPAGVAATAPSDRADIVCRYFAPSHGVGEDPGTGSIQCGLVPYWSARLGKPAIRTLQLSRRGAELFGELRGDRTAISGQVVKYLEGWIEV